MKTTPGRPAPANNVLRSAKHQAHLERQFVRISAIHAPASANGVPGLSRRYTLRLQGVKGHPREMEERFLLDLIDRFAKRFIEICEQKVVRLKDPMTDDDRRRLAVLQDDYRDIPGDVNFLLAVFDVYSMRWNNILSAARTN